MLSKLFSRTKKPAEPAFQPDPNFCIGAIELLTNALSDHGTFQPAFDAIPQWDIAPASGGVTVAHTLQMIGGVLQNKTVNLTFGHADQAFIEIMVIDTWVNLRGFTYSGFQTTPSGAFASEATLPVGASGQIVFKVQPSAQMRPYAGLVAPGTLLNMEFHGSL